MNKNINEIKEVLIKNIERIILPLPESEGEYLFVVKSNRRVMAAWEILTKGYTTFIGSIAKKKITKKERR